MKLTGPRVLRAVILTATLLEITAWPVFAGDIYVIANTATSVTAEEIKSIYTGEKELAGGTKLKPADNSAVKEEFLNKALQIDSGRYDSLWVKKSFRDGVTEPAAKSSDEEIIAYVKSTPGAIGYIRTPPPSTVTLVKKF